MASRNYRLHKAVHLGLRLSHRRREAGGGKVSIVTGAGGRVSVAWAGGGRLTPPPPSCHELAVSRCSKRAIFRAIAPLDMKVTKHTPSTANVWWNGPCTPASTPFLSLSLSPPYVPASLPSLHYPLFLLFLASLSPSLLLPILPFLLTPPFPSYLFLRPSLPSLLPILSFPPSSFSLPFLFFLSYFFPPVSS